MHALLKYLLLVLEVFLVLGPFSILKDFYLCIQNLWPFLFYDLGCYLIRESHYNHLAALELVVYIAYITGKSYSYHHLLFPPYFLPGFQGAQTLAFWVSRVEFYFAEWSKNVKIRKTHNLHYKERWKRKESADLQLGLKVGGRVGWRVGYPWTSVIIGEKMKSAEYNFDCFYTHWEMQIKTEITFFFNLWSLDWWL